MDDSPLPAPPAAAGHAAPSAPFPDQRQFGHRPGRPPDDPARREAGDRAYAAAKEFEGMLPAKAKEARVLIFELHPKTLVKRSAQPIGQVLQTQMKDMGVAENPEAMPTYLNEHFGPGTYRIEPADEHGRRMEKLASWIETVPDSENPMGDAIDEPIDTTPGTGRRFGRRRRDEVDDEVDDEGRGKVDVEDLMLGLEERRREDTERSASSGMNMMQMMMLQNREASRLEEARRREDRERETQEERRREEARKTDEERRRVERKEEEDRRREERREEENRRREDREGERKREESRLAMMTGLITAGSTILGKLLEPKPQDETLKLILAKTLEPKPQDPLVTTLLTKMLDTSQQKLVMEQMHETSKMSTQIQGQVFTQTMAASLEMQSAMHKRAMEDARRSSRDDGGGSSSTLDKVVDLIGKAGTLVQQLVPAGIGGHAAIAAPAAPAQAAPAQPAATMVAPTGVEAVVRSMITLQTGRTVTGEALTQDQRGNVAAFLIDELPDDLFDAIASNDEASIQRITQPMILSNSQYVAWISRAGVLDWVRGFLGELRPELIRIRQDEQEQAAKSASAAAATAPATAAPAPTQPVAAAAPIAGPGAVAATDDRDSPV